MTARLLRVAAFAVAALLLTHLAPGADKKPAPQKQFTAREVAFFEKDVLPILKANCFKCHADKKPRGGLHLTSRAAVLQGGDTGPAVALDNPDTSLLLKAINYRGGLEMPPKGKLPQKDIDTLTRWVKAGAPWTPGTTIIHAPKHKGGVVTEEARNYWAYRPIQRPAVPPVTESAWIANPIDAFILARLEAKGLKPNPPAERVALVRRAYYDLTGLPPTPAEVDAFVNDRSPRAYEKLLDRLLASPHYGEKWGRHWLDLVRYAETNGYERDGPKPFAWRFRDYVIKSFNADKPYDRFVKEQLAGDEIDRNDADAVTATGYYRLGLWDDEPADGAQARADEIDDLVATTAQVFLGMTMNCARCHDHKIDPIPQKDYYRLAAFFGDVRLFAESRNPAARAHLTDVSPPQERAGYERELRRRQDRMAELQTAMRKIEDEAIRKMPAADQRAAEGAGRPQVLRKLRRFLTAEQSATYRKLNGELNALRKKPNPSHGLALSVNECLVNPPPTHVLIRGLSRSPGVKVEPGFPTVLSRSAPTIPTPAKGARSSGRRTVLADWIVSKDNPMTARVLANRLWQHHFGRGIVASTNDFGKFGTPPTYPELLNWLADELMRGGWKLKRMHKLLMMSNAYRLSSAGSAAGLKADPDNALFWRFNMRRLTAEEVRDSILAVSGRLNLKMGGPSIYPPIPREVLAGQSVPGQGWHTSPPAEAARRSVYVHVKRSLLVPVLSQHDQADTDSSCPVRYTTTVPTQALGMLNGQFTNEQAEALARRLEREAPGDLEKQVGRAIRLSTGRVPADTEVKKDAAFARVAGLRPYCLLILNTNEFIYLD